MSPLGVLRLITKLEVNFLKTRIQKRPEDGSRTPLHVHKFQNYQNLAIF